MKWSEHVCNVDWQPAVHRGAVQHQIAVQQNDEERDERYTRALVEDWRGAAAQAAQSGPVEAHLAQGGHGARVAQRGLRESAEAFSLSEQAHRGASESDHTALHEQQHGV